VDWHTFCTLFATECPVALELFMPPATRNNIFVLVLFFVFFVEEKELRSNFSAKFIFPEILQPVEEENGKKL
jgi:hypothetical protein